MEGLIPVEGFLGRFHGKFSQFHQFHYIFPSPVGKMMENGSNPHASGALNTLESSGLYEDGGRGA